MTLSLSCSTITYLLCQKVLKKKTKQERDFSQRKYRKQYFIITTIFLGGPINPTT